MPRKVAIERIEGGDHPHVHMGAVKEGWELVRPTVGERYLLFTDTGSIFRSSKVTRVVGQTFDTRNSTYSVRVLEDDKPASLVTQEIRVPVMPPVR